MKLLPLALATASLTTAQAHAQTAPLDTAATRATYAQPSKRIQSKSGGPESPIVKRSYTTNGKGVQVELIERADGRKEERPYVPLPLLFAVGSDELLDGVSRDNVRELAAILRDFTAKGASFSIQGHASAEGDGQANLTLSERRAEKIRSLLVEAHGLGKASLSAQGFGSTSAKARPDAPENERQKDRRVLVVKN